MTIPFKTSWIIRCTWKNGEQMDSGYVKGYIYRVDSGNMVLFNEGITDQELFPQKADAIALNDFLKATKAYTNLLGEDTVVNTHFLQVYKSHGLFYAGEDYMYTQVDSTTTLPPSEEMF